MTDAESIEVVRPEVPLAVVVVNYGSHALIAENLVASLRDAPAGTLGVVVDNFTTRAEADAVDALCREQGWLALLSPTNLGFGGGVDLGVAAAVEKGADVLVMLNPDARIDGADLARLASAVRANPRELVAPVVTRPDGSIFAQAQDLYLSDGHMRSTRRRPADVAESDVLAWVSGACFAVSSALWADVDGFDPDYFLYWEDVDVSVRIQRAGGTLRVDPEISALHDEGGTHGFTGDEQAKSPIYYYYNVRNRLLFAGKHLDAKDRRRWVRSTLRVSAGIVLQGGKRQLRHPSRTLLPAVRGVRDGLRELRREARRRDAAGTS